MYDPISISVMKRREWMVNGRRFFDENPISPKENEGWHSYTLTTEENMLETFRKHYASTIHAAHIGEHYFIERQFKQLAEFAAKDIPLDTVFDESLLPTMNGWAYIQGSVQPVEGEIDLPILAWYRVGEREDAPYQLMFMRERMPTFEEADRDNAKLIWTHFSMYPGQTLAESLKRNSQCEGWLQTAYSIFHLMGQRLAITTPSHALNYAVKGGFRCKS